MENYMQMEISNTQKHNSHLKMGWTLLMFVGIIQSISAFFLWVGSGPDVIEADTGVA